MLSFFRHHQKWFFLIITVIIVISFSFFGAMQQMRDAYVEDPIAFTTANRLSVHRAELEQMANFLATDAQDRVQFRGAREINFLNDGVIEQDFLATGLAPMIVAQYRDFLAADLKPKRDRERKFHLYHHPKADFIGVEKVWEVVAPELNAYFETIQSSEDPLSEESVDARAKLYLGYRSFPDYAIRQALHKKMEQNSWVGPDPNLPQTDISPFGYRVVEEWFGPRFTRVVAGLILEFADLAESKGIEVSYQEAQASLLKQAAKSYHETRYFRRNSSETEQQYLANYLRAVRSDMNQMVSVWRKILLFRRYFDTYGGAALVDGLPFAKFAAAGQEYAQGELYSLPAAMNVESLRDLAFLEGYLGRVTVAGDDPLAFPRPFLSVDAIAKKAPGLVYQEYEVQVARGAPADFYATIPVRKMWEWQTQEKNWSLLQKEFPVDLKGNAKTDSDRFAILEKLDTKSRAEIDRFSREMMVEVDEEMMTTLLSEKGGKSAKLQIPLEGGSSPFPGIASLSVLAQPFAKGEDFTYSGDGKTFYRFSKIEKTGPLQVKTFVQAKKEGSLKEGDLDLVLQVLKPSGATLSKDELARTRFHKLMENLRETIGKPEVQAEWVGEESSSFLQQFKLMATPFKVNKYQQKGVVNPAEAFAVAVGKASDLTTTPSGEITFFLVKDKGVEAPYAAIQKGAESGRALIAGEANRALFAKTLQQGDVAPQYFKHE